MNAMTCDPRTRQLVYRATLALAACCDGARARDGTGYNSEDTFRMCGLARLDPRQWSDGDVHEAYWRLAKYQRQLLENHDIDWQEMRPVGDPPVRVDIWREL